MSNNTDVIVIGAGHNGLTCASYLARAGLGVVVLESSDTPGGCINTIDLPDGRGKMELGAYEHGGIVGSGVAADLELESRFGLSFHMRDEVTLAPCDDGSALAFYASLEQTLEGLEPIVGKADTDAYRNFAAWSAAALGLLRQTEAGPPPSLRELAAAAELTLGAESGRLLQTLFASASTMLRGQFSDERLQGPMAHWAAHSEQSPSDPGTAAGALMLAGGHGHKSARPVGGSRSAVEALVRCLESYGGQLHCSAAVEKVELSGGRAVAVQAAGQRWTANRAVVSAVDARRLFLTMMAPEDVPPSIRDEVRRIHVGQSNVSELKVDAILSSKPKISGPEGFDRSFMLSANTTTDLERAFASIRHGDLPERTPVMIAFPSSLESGWAPEGGANIWLSTFVPWPPRSGAWNEAEMERAADNMWQTAERALGCSLDASERRLTGPADWVARHGNPHANPNHVEMSLDQLLAFRPSPKLSGYRTPIENLFLTGAGTHPGGGITGVPGRNAAAVALEQLGLAPRKPFTERARSQAALLRDAGKAALALRRAS